MAGKGGWPRHVLSGRRAPRPVPVLSPVPLPRPVTRAASGRTAPRARATCSVAAGGLGVLAVILNHFLSQVGRNIVIVIEGGAEGTAAPGDRP